jgi:hypothetical protein
VFINAGDSLLLKECTGLTKENKSLVMTEKNADITPSSKLILRD